MIHGMRIQLLPCVLLLCGLATAATTEGEQNRVRHRPAAQQSQPDLRIIVKLRPLSTASSGTVRALSASSIDRMATLTTRVGLASQGARAITDQMQVLRVET